MDGGVWGGGFFGFVKGGVFFLCVTFFFYIFVLRYLSMRYRSIYSVSCHHPSTFSSP